MRIVRMVFGVLLLLAGFGAAFGAYYGAGGRDNSFSFERLQQRDEQTMAIAAVALTLVGVVALATMKKPTAA